MRFSNRRLLHLAVLTLLGLGLAVALTACPGGVVSLGVLDVGADATNTDRCDDGVKVVVEGIQEEWGFRGPSYSDTSGFRAKGPNWIWVEPGHWHSIQWEVFVNAPASKNPEGKQITVKAYCMRKDAEPGLSQRTFALADYMVTRGSNRILEMELTVRDSGSDPSYTVTPPGLSIEDHE